MRQSWEYYSLDGPETAFARNIWYITALADIDVQYEHVMGKANRTADLLSRWMNSWSDKCELENLVGTCTWVSTSLDLMEIIEEKSKWQN